VPGIGDAVAVAKIGVKVAGTVAVASSLVRKADTAADAVRGASGFTRSSLQLGQQMHRAYKAGLADNIRTFKEFRLPSGGRIDFLDVQRGIIHELKPNNPRAIREGLQQLQRYRQELESLPVFQGIDWKTVLDTY